MIGVYEIVNLADGKMTSYVGGSVDIKTRWQQHIRALRRGDHRNPHLQRAWARDGEGAFSFCVLEQAKSEKDLLEREQYFLDRAFEVGSTYNIARDVNKPPPRKNCVLSQEHRRKISEALMGKRNGLGYRHTEEARRKISMAGMGRVFSDESRRKIGEANRRRIVSQETRRKLSEASKGNQNWLGQKLSEEHRRKISDGKAKPYPAFVHRKTGEIIPAGRNLKALCWERGLARRHMWAVMHGKHKHHKGWTLANNQNMDRRQEK